MIQGMSPRRPGNQSCGGHYLWPSFAAWFHTNLERGEPDDTVAGVEVFERFARDMVGLHPANAVTKVGVGNFMRCMQRNIRWAIHKETRFRPIRWSGLRWREAEVVAQPLASSLSSC